MLWITICLMAFIDLGHSSSSPETLVVIGKFMIIYLLLAMILAIKIVSRAVIFKM